MAMKRLSPWCQLNPISASVEQLQAQLSFEFAHRCEDSRMRTMQGLSGGLKTTGTDYRIEALQVMESKWEHVRSYYKGF